MKVNTWGLLPWSQPEKQLRQQEEEVLKGKEGQEHQEEPDGEEEGQGGGQWERHLGHTQVGRAQQGKTTKVKGDCKKRQL